MVQEKDIKAYKNKLYQSISEVSKIENLVKTEGWEILHDWLISRIIIGQDNMMTCDIQQIPNIRGKLEAYKEMLNLPNFFLSDKDRILDEIKKIEESETNAFKYQSLTRIK